MSTHRPNAERDPSPFLLSLPRIEDIPVTRDGYDRGRVEDAFDVFERQLGTLQARLAVLETAATSAGALPSAHPVRMDALHLIRQAAEYADTLERDAVDAVARQIEQARADMQTGVEHLAERLADLRQRREEFERERAALLSEARRQAAEVLSTAQRDADELRRDAEARATRLVEQARHEATELTNATRVEVERMLDWARRHAETVLDRAREGAERLLAAAGADPTVLEEVSGALLNEVVEGDEPSPEAEADPSAPSDEPPPER
jgi:cell division septum initiation protein DivIVA